MSTKLIADGIKLAEHARNLHRIAPDSDTTIDDVLKPDYWSHVGAKIAVGDKMEILPVDGAWYLEALVVSCSRVHVKLVVLVQKEVFERAKKDPKTPAAAKAPFEIAFKGPQRKWSVIRTKDATYVKEAFSSREEAEAWLKENEADLTGA